MTLPSNIFQLLKGGYEKEEFDRIRKENKAEKLIKAIIKGCAHIL